MVITDSDAALDRLQGLIRPQGPILLAFLQRIHYPFVSSLGETAAAAVHVRGDHLLPEAIASKSGESLVPPTAGRGRNVGAT